MTKTPYFTVRNVTDDCLPDFNSRIVGITEDRADPSAKYFLFQRALGDFTDEDHRLGMDTYAISNEQGKSSYGSLASYKLSGTKLVLNFTVDGAESLGVPTTVELNLALADEDVETLRSGLREVVEA